MAVALIFSLLLTQEVNAILTQTGTCSNNNDVYVDSTVGSQSGYSSCATGTQTSCGAINNKFFTTGVWPQTVDGSFIVTMGCCSTTKPSTLDATIPTYLNIKFTNPTTVQQVVVIGREDSAADTAIDAAPLASNQLYVGNWPNPVKNTACDSAITTSGVYACGGLVGKYLGIYKADTTGGGDSICQIRAYSYVANTATNTFTFSPSVAGQSGNQLATWKESMLTVTASVFTDASSSGNAYMQMVFSAKRFIHTILMIGDTTSSYAYSQNWYLTVGKDDLYKDNSRVGYWQNKYDNQGKETVAKTWGTKVTAYRTDNQILSFKWFAVFSTSCQCDDSANTFSWTATPSTISDITTVGTTTATVIAVIRDTANSADSDCALAHIANLKLGSVTTYNLPSFITFDGTTKTLSFIVTDASQNGSYTIVVTAYLTDGVSFPSRIDTKEITVIINIPTFTPTTVFNDAFVADYGFTLAQYFAYTLDPATSYTILQDAKRQYDAVKANADTYNTDTVTGGNCGSNFNAKCERSGFTSFDYQGTQITNGFSECKKASSTTLVTSGASNIDTCETLLVNYYQSFTTTTQLALFKSAMRALAFNNVWAKYTGGAGADKTVTNFVPNEYDLIIEYNALGWLRSSKTQLVAITAGTTNDFIQPAYLDTTFAKDYIPMLAAAGGAYTSEMYWILTQKYTRFQIVEGIQIAKLFLSDFYTTETDLAKSEKDLFPTTGTYLSSGLTSTITSANAVTSDLTANTVANLKVQMTCLVIYLMRGGSGAETGGTLGQASSAVYINSGISGAPLTATTTKSSTEYYITKYELSLYGYGTSAKFYTSSDRTVKLSDANMITYISACRALSVGYTKMGSATGYDYNQAQTGCPTTCVNYAGPGSYYTKLALIELANSSKYTAQTTQALSFDWPAYFMTCGLVTNTWSWTTSTFVTTASPYITTTSITGTSVATFSDTSSDCTTIAHTAQLKVAQSGTTVYYNLPNWITYDTSTKVLTVNPSNVANGDYVVQIKSTLSYGDHSTRTDTKEYTFTINVPFSYTDNDVSDYGFTLKMYFDNILTISISETILQDAMRIYNAAKTNADTANTSSTGFCGVNGDKSCSYSGWTTYGSTYIQTTNALTDCNQAASGLTGAPFTTIADCETAVLTQYGTFTSQAGLLAGIKKLAFQASLAKYIGGAGTSTITVPNTWDIMIENNLLGWPRTSSTQYVKPTAGTAGYFTQPTYFIPSWITTYGGIPMSQTGGSDPYKSEMYWILKNKYTQQECVESQQFFLKFSVDYYDSPTDSVTLNSYHLGLFPSTGATYLSSFQTSTNAAIGGATINTRQNYKYQWTCLAVYLMRGGQNAETGAAGVGAAGSAIYVNSAISGGALTAVAGTTATTYYVTPIELGLYGYGTLTKYLAKPLTKTQMLTFISECRAASVAYKWQLADISKNDGNSLDYSYSVASGSDLGYYYWWARNQIYTASYIAGDYITSSQSQDAEIATIWSYLYTYSFVTDKLLAGTDNSWNQLSTVTALIHSMNGVTSYFNAIQGYIGLSSGTSTTTHVYNTNVVQYQKNFMSSSYFPWIVQQDLETETGVTFSNPIVDSDLVKMAEWYTFYYIRHPIQNWRIHELLMVLQSVRDLNAADMLGQILDDSLDSLALQTIVDLVYAYTTNATPVAPATAKSLIAFGDVTSKFTSYTVNTSQMRLRYAYAYIQVMCPSGCANTGYADYSQYDTAATNNQIRPEFVWWAQIPFGGSGVKTGITNLFALLTKWTGTLTADDMGVLYTTPSIMDSSKFDCVGTTSASANADRLTNWNAISTTGTPSKQQIAAGMQSVLYYWNNYEPEKRQINYSAAPYSTSYSTNTNGVWGLYNGDTDFTATLALLNANTKMQVTDNSTKKAQLMSDTLWYFTRQLTALSSYSSVLSVSAYLATGSTVADFTKTETSWTNSLNVACSSMTSQSFTTKKGILTVSLGYAIQSLVFDYQGNTAITSAPTTSNFGFSISSDGTTAMPLTALQMFNTYLYSANDVYNLYGGYATNRATSSSYASATLLASVKALRKDKRFRLYDAFFTGFSLLDYNILGSQGNFDGLTNTIAQVTKFDTYKFELATAFAAGWTKMSDLNYLIRIGERLYNSKLYWANNGSTCGSTCLDTTSTGTVQPALEFLEALSSTTPKNWLWLKTTQIYAAQNAMFGVTAAGTDINEGAYITVGFSDSQFEQIYYPAATVSTAIQTVRAVTQSIYWKDYWIDKSTPPKLYTKIGDSTTALTWLKLTVDSNDNHQTFYELMWLDRINTDITVPTNIYLTPLTSPMTLQQFTAPYYSSWILINSSKLSSTDDNLRREQINDILFVANAIANDSNLNTGDLGTTTSWTGTLSDPSSAKDIWAQLSTDSTKVTTVLPLDTGYLYWPRKTVTTSFSSPFYAFLTCMDYHFHSYHQIEAPDAYETYFLNQLIKHKKADMAFTKLLAQQNVDIVYLQKVWTYSARGKKMSSLSLPTVATDFVTDGVLDQDKIRAGERAFGSPSALTLYVQCLVTITPASGSDDPYTAFTDLTLNAGDVIWDSTGSSSALGYLLQNYMTDAELQRMYLVYKTLSDAFAADSNSSTTSTDSALTTLTLTVSKIATMLSTANQALWTNDKTGFNQNMSVQQAKLTAGTQVLTASSSQDLVNYAIAGSNKADLCKYIAMADYLTTRTSAADASPQSNMIYGLGFTMQLYTAATPGVQVAWDATTVQAVYDTAATKTMTAQEWSIASELYVRNCHLTALSAETYAIYTNLGYSNGKRLYPSGISSTDSNIVQCFFLADLQMRYYGYRDINWQGIDSTAMKVIVSPFTATTDADGNKNTFDWFCNSNSKIDTYAKLATQMAYSSRDLRNLMAMCYIIKSKAATSQVNTKCNVVADLASASDQMKTNRIFDFARSSNIMMVFYKVTSGTRTFITQYMPCPVQLLSLAHPNYENRHLSVDDALIVNDSGNNRFQQFAYYNRDKYYPHVTDATITTDRTLLNDAGSWFYDVNGSLSTDNAWSGTDPLALWKLQTSYSGNVALWKATDVTTAWGIQMGQFVWNAYDYYYAQFTSQSGVYDSGTNASGIKLMPFELDIYQMDEEELLQRQFTPTQFNRFVTLIRASISTTYQIPANLFGVTPRTLTSYTTAATNALAKLGTTQTPESIAAALILYDDATYKVNLAGTFPWVYQNKQDDGTNYAYPLKYRFWGRINNRFVGNSPQPYEDYNNRSWLANLVYNSYVNKSPAPFYAKQGNLVFDYTMLTKINTDEVDSRFAFSSSPFTKDFSAITLTAEQITVAWNIFRLVSNERWTRKHLVEELTYIEKLMLWAAASIMNTASANSDLSFFITNDIAKMEIEEIGQNLRESQDPNAWNYVDTATGRIGYTAAQDSDSTWLAAFSPTPATATLGTDAAGQQTNKYPTWLSDRLTAIQQTYRSTTYSTPPNPVTWTNLYTANAKITTTYPNYTVAKLQQYLLNFSGVDHLYYQMHAPEWSTFIADATATSTNIKGSITNQTKLYNMFNLGSNLCSSMVQGNGLTDSTSTGPTDAQVLAAFGNQLKNADGTAVTTVEKLCTFVNVVSNQSTYTLQTVSDWLAGSITINAYGASGSAKTYLKYQRRYYDWTSIVLKYWPTTGPLKLDGNPCLFEEAYIALSIARVKRQKDFDFNFSLLGTDNVKGLNKALPNSYYSGIYYPTVTTKLWTPVNIGKWAMERAREYALTIEPFYWDYTARYQQPVDLSVDNLTTNFANKLYTTSEIQFVFYKGTSIGGVSLTKYNQAIAIIKDTWNGNKLYPGRESNLSYIDPDFKARFYGDWHYKPAPIVRPIRATYNWASNTDFNTNLAAMDDSVSPAYTKGVETAFRQSSLLNDWTLFSEQFTSLISGWRTGANFQGPEDFVFVIWRGNQLLNWLLRRYLPGTTQTDFTIQAMNEIKHRDYEWYIPWDTANVRGKFLVSKDQPHNDVGQFMDLWTWINSIGNVNDVLVEPRTWLTRAISGTKANYNVRNVMLPQPTWITETDILLSNRLKASGDGYTWQTSPINYSIAPYLNSGGLSLVPTLKQQCAFLAYDFMFGTGAPAVSSMVALNYQVGVTVNLPAIDYRIIRFMGFYDFYPIQYFNWGVTDYQNIIAKWRYQAKCQQLDGTPSWYAYISNLNLYLTQAKLTQVNSLWTQANGQDWTFNTLVAAGYSDWSMLITYEYYYYWIKSTKAVYTAPKFYCDYTADIYNSVAGESLVPDIYKNAAWHLYFTTNISIQDVLDTTSATGVVKYTWWDINDMFTYAQMLYRKQQNLLSGQKAGYQIKDLDKIILDSGLTGIVTYTTIGLQALQLTKLQTGLISYYFKKQIQHDVQVYNDYEVSGFSYMKASGFDDQGLYNNIIQNFWNNEDIQMIIETSRTIQTPLSDAVISALVLQDSWTTGDQLFRTGGIDPTNFNNASGGSILTVKNSQIQSKRMTQQWLKLQIAIAAQKVNFPVQTDEKQKFPTPMMTSALQVANSANSLFTLTWNQGKSNSDLWNYQFHTLTLTANYLVAPAALVVINLADNMALATGAAGKEAFTSTELTSIGVTQAVYDGYTQAQRNWIAGPIALARYKVLYKNPNRIYSSTVLQNYGMTTSQLTYSVWQNNEPQYCVYLASFMTVPITQTQINLIRADYTIWNSVDPSVKKLFANPAYTNQSPLSTVLDIQVGQLAILNYGKAAYDIWNNYEPKPANVFIQRTIDKFSVTLAIVLANANLQRAGWFYVFNQAWDYSLNQNQVAGGATRTNPPYLAFSGQSIDQKAFLLAMWDLQYGPNKMPTLLGGNLPTQTAVDFGLYAFTPLWLTSIDINGPMMDNVLFFAKYWEKLMSVQSIIGNTSAQLSGAVAMAKYTNVGEITRATSRRLGTALAPNFYYLGLTEYQVAKYGWNVYIDTQCASALQSLTLYCQCYYPTDTTVPIGQANQKAACIQLSYLVTTLQPDELKGSPSFVLTYASLTQQQKTSIAAYDTYRSSVLTTLFESNLGKFLVGSSLAQEYYKTIQINLLADIPKYGYDLQSMIMYWIAQDDLVKVDQKCKPIGSTNPSYVMTSTDLSNYQLVTQGWSANTSGKIPGFMPTSSVTIGSETTDMRCFWLYINSNLSILAERPYTQTVTGVTGTEKLVQPVVSLRGIANNRYVYFLKQADGFTNTTTVDWPTTAKQIRLYITDTGLLNSDADYLQAGLTFFQLGLTQAQFVQVMKQVSLLEDWSNLTIPATKPNTAMITSKFSQSDILNLTWKRQFFEIAYYMVIDKNGVGITENQFATYGFDYFVRTKFIDENRATLNDFVNMYNTASTRCGTFNAFTAAELAVVVPSLPTLTTPSFSASAGLATSDTLQCGRIAMDAYLTKMSLKPTSQQFFFSQLQQNNMGLTNIYQNLFAQTADLYIFSLVSETIKNLNAKVNGLDGNGNTIPVTNDQLRGISALNYLQNLYPTYDFKADPSIAYDGLLTSDLINLLGTNMQWYLQKFYSHEEMRYILRVAEKYWEGNQNMIDLNAMNVKVNDFNNMSFEAFSVMYAEYQLALYNGPQTQNAQVWKGGPNWVTANNISTSIYITISKWNANDITNMQFYGIDVIPILQFNITPEKLVNLYATLPSQAATLLQPVTAGTTTASAFATAGELACKKPTGAFQAVSATGTQQAITSNQVAAFTAFCQAVIPTYVYPELQMTQTVFNFYGLTQSRITSNNLSRWQIIQLLKLVNTNVSAKGLNPYSTTKVTYSSWSNKDILLWISDISLAWSEAQAQTWYTQNSGQNSVSFKAADVRANMLDIYLKAYKALDQVTLNTYGISLSWYSTKWLNILDLAELIIYAKKQNTLLDNDASWNASGSTTAGFASMTKPQKSMILSYAVLTNASLITVNAPASGLTIDMTVFSNYGFSVNDFVFANIKSTDAPNIIEYISNYNTANIAVGGKDAYILTSSSLSTNVAVYQVVMYQLTQLIIPSVSGYQYFQFPADTMFNYEKYGLTAAQVQQDISFSYLDPSSYQKILAIAQALYSSPSVSNNFPDVYNVAAYYNYGILADDGVTKITTVFQISSSSIYRFAGQVARNKYLQNLKLTGPTMQAVPMELKFAGFYFLQTLFPGLLDSDAQGFYQQFLTIYLSNQTIDKIYTQAFAIWNAYFPKNQLNNEKILSMKLTTQNLMAIIAFDNYRKLYQNNFRNFLSPMTLQLGQTSSTDGSQKTTLYGINFTNMNGNWYTLTQLNQILINAQSLYTTYLTMCDSSVIESKQTLCGQAGYKPCVCVGNFSQQQLLMNFFQDNQNNAKTPQVLAGIIAFAKYNQWLQITGQAIFVDKSMILTLPNAVPPIKPQIQSLDSLGNTVYKTAYGSADYNMYNLDPYYTLSQGKVQGMADLYSVVDMANFIAQRYYLDTKKQQIDAAQPINALYIALGYATSDGQGGFTNNQYSSFGFATVSALAQAWNSQSVPYQSLKTLTTEQNAAAAQALLKQQYYFKIGILSVALVNNQLFPNSNYFYNQAYYFGIPLPIDPAKYNLVEFAITDAYIEIQNTAVFQANEDLFTAQAYMSFNPGYTNYDIYTKVLPLLSNSWVIKNFYYSAGMIATNFNNMAIPSDPSMQNLPGVLPWLSGESLKYGVFSSFVKYPGLMPSPDTTFTGIRNTVFMNIRNIIVNMADQYTQSMLNGIIDAQVAAQQLILAAQVPPSKIDLRFNVPQYTKAVQSKFFSVTMLSQFTNKEINGIMNIVKPILYDQCFQGGQYYKFGIQTAYIANYASLFAKVGITDLSQIVEDSSMPNAGTDTTLVLNPTKITGSMALGKAAAYLFYTNQTVFQVVDLPLDQQTIATYGINLDNLNANKITTYQARSIIALADRLTPWIYPAQDPYLPSGVTRLPIGQETGPLYANVTAAYGSEPGAIATDKMRSFAVAYNYYYNGHALDIAPTAPMIPSWASQFSYEQLALVKVTYLDIINGIENVCTIRAKLKVAAFIPTPTTTSLQPSIPFYVDRLINKNPNLTFQDYQVLPVLALNAAWLEVTAEIGLEPRTFRELIAITKDIRDVCNMVEADFMQLTGKTAYLDNTGAKLPAQDYYGVAIKNQCDPTTFQIVNGAFQYSQADLASLNLSQDYVNSFYSIAQIQQWLCVRKYMDAKYQLNKAKADAQALLTSQQILASIGYDSNKIVSILGYGWDQINSISNFKVNDIAATIFKRIYNGSASTYDGALFRGIAVHMGINGDILTARGMNYVDQLQLMDNFLNYSSLTDRYVVNWVRMLTTPSADAQFRAAMYGYNLTRAVSGSIPAITISTSTADSDVAQKIAEWMVNSGRVCKSTISSSTAPIVQGLNVIAPIPSTTTTAISTSQVSLLSTIDTTFTNQLKKEQKYCDMFTNIASVYYRNGPSSTNIYVPRSNVDMFMTYYTKTDFTIDPLFSLKNSIFSYESLIQALAMFPAFCDPSQPVDNCKRQIAAFLSVTQKITNGLQNLSDFCPNNKVATTVVGAQQTYYNSNIKTKNSKECYFYPEIESTASHWLGPIIDNLRGSNSKYSADITKMYYARGAGFIKGAEQYYRFAQDIGQIDSQVIQSWSQNAGTMTISNGIWYQTGTSTKLSTDPNIICGTLLDKSDYVCEKHLTSAKIGNVQAPVQNQPYNMLTKFDQFTSIDQSFTTLSIDGSYLPSQYATSYSSGSYIQSITYKIFSNPSLLETDGRLAWASGLWQFLTPVAVEIDNYKSGFYTEIQSPSDNPFKVYYEQIYHTVSANAWLLGQFTPTFTTDGIFGFQSIITPWTGPSTYGLRGVLKTYFGADCKKTSTASITPAYIAQVSANYAAYILKFGYTNPTATSSDAGPTDICDACTSSLLQKDPNFAQPMFFATSAQTIDINNRLTRYYPLSGACYITNTPTPYRVFEAGAYKQCVADSYVTFSKPVGLNFGF